MNNLLGQSCRLFLLQQLSVWSAGCVIEATGKAVLCCCGAVLLLWTPAAAAQHQPYYCTRYRVSRTGKRNRSYEYNHLRIMHRVSHTHTVNQSRHQVPGITRRGFQTSVLDREHSNVYTYIFGRQSSILCGGSLLGLEHHHRDILCTTHHIIPGMQTKKYNAD